METLTDRQKKIALKLIEWAQDRVGGETDELLVEEDQLKDLLGDRSWKRANVDDLNVLCAYCDRMGYPMVPLLVVIPGLRKPEKTIFTHAFKTTLPTAENNRRWKEALKDIEKTKKATWEEFAANVTPEEDSKRKRTARATDEAKASAQEAGAGAVQEAEAETA